MVNLSLVIPCFNEQDVLPETAGRLRAVLDDLVAKGKVVQASGVYFIDDGSSDGTWKIIERLAKEYPSFHGIRLSRNCGHQNALLAGLLTVPGDAVITMDADLQDDPAAIERMVDAYKGGAEIVYGVREERENDDAMKRFTAEAYYRILARLRVNIVFNHADYRLMSRRAIRNLSQFREVNLFLRGIVPLIGFRTDTIYYRRNPRVAGKSKYSIAKMLALALDGVTSFSNVPLRAIFLTGLLISFLSFAVGCYVILLRVLDPASTVHGWASTVLPICFLGGIQILCIGIIGEYLGKVYMESKHRPPYFIEAFTAEMPDTGTTPP